MGYSMSLRSSMNYGNAANEPLDITKKKKKKKEPKKDDLSQYDDTHYWTKD